MGVEIIGEGAVWGKCGAFHYSIIINEEDVV